MYMKGFLMEYLLDLPVISVILQKEKEYQI